MIGILGGTFDPIHLGHLHIASQVCKQLGLSQLRFMPCALPVHRGLPRATAEQRCRMIQLALQGNDRFALSRIELEREGPSYSVDSLREMRKQTDERLLLVLGSDAYHGFAQWKQPEEILELASLVVCGRPGFEIEAGPYAQHHVESVPELLRHEAGAILPLQVDAPDCSSSAVRAALNQGRLPRNWLAPGVADYIDEHNLYREQGD